MDALFDVTPQPAPPQESEGQRRTRRQRELLAAGQHPLTLVLSHPLRLHADAAPGGDKRADGLRCGTCSHRTYATSNGRHYPKCTVPGRMSNGAATDCRAWWPACVNHLPQES